MEPEISLVPVTVLSGSILFAILTAFFAVKLHFSKFRIITTIFLFQIFMVNEIMFLDFFAAADLKGGEGSIYRGKPRGGKADCTLTLADEDLIGLATGKLNPQNVRKIDKNLSQSITKSTK